MKNAIHFTKYGSIIIKVLYNVAKKSLEVQVCDTGDGISSDQLHSLFDESSLSFKSIKKDKCRGLLIAKTIVERIGGTI